MSAPVLTLRPVTAQNWRAVAKLAPAEDQRRFIADNVWSLAEAHYDPLLVPRAIYHGDTPVGFAMDRLLADEGQPGEIAIFRFMIAQAYQGRGLGKAAFAMLLEHLRRQAGITRISISYDPANTVAQQLYAGFGFRETGIDPTYDEMIAVLDL